jgi:putative FmdB family regulatory protein
MPIYEYERQDGTRFEVRQGFHDAALSVCPTTGQSVRRVLSPAGIIFKGSGWYKTDSRPAASESDSSKSASSATSNGASEGSAAAGGAKADESKTSAKPAESKPATPVAAD